jgi:hypothetical protein
VSAQNTEGQEIFDESWDIQEEFGVTGEEEGGYQQLENLLGSGSQDSAHYRRLQKAAEDHKRSMEAAKASFERDIERFKTRHDRWTNYILLFVVSVIFLISVGVLSHVAYHGKNEDPLREKAIALLAPLTGLALGFLSGKIKWPAL